MTPIGRKLNPWQARVILVLAELLALARTQGRPLTLEEFCRVWFGPNGERSPAAIKQARMRLKRWLRDHGVTLRMETHEEHGLEIHVDAPDLAVFVLARVLEAREVEERQDAKREGRAPDLESVRESGAPLTGEDLARVYNSGNVSDHFGGATALRTLARARWDRLRDLLEKARIEIRDERRPRIEETRAPEVVARALQVLEEGGSVRDVQAVLACGYGSAHRFVMRQKGGPMRPRGRPARRLDVDPVTEQLVAVMRRARRQRGGTIES